MEEHVDDDIETVAMVRNAIQQFQEILSYSKNFPEELKIAIMNLDDNSALLLGNSGHLNINSGGILNALGSENNEVTLESNDANYWQFNCY
jgi:hypothetical protein